MNKKYQMNNYQKTNLKPEPDLEALYIYTLQSIPKPEPKSKPEPNLDPNLT